MKTSTAEKKETKIVTLDQVNVRKLPELKGWKDKQRQIVKDHPFIAIEDNKSYEEAKKNRTALRSARTTIQDQDKLIASKLRELRSEAGKVAAELIEITQPHEDKQQEEVKRYEAEKEAERIEKERIEKERIENIKSEINQFYTTWKDVISKMAFNDVENQKKEILLQLEEKDKKGFAEFQEEFNDKVKLLRELFKERVQFLNEREEARKAQEKLDEERREYEAQKAKEEEERKKREAKEKAERDAEAEKLRKERADIEAEKKRITDAEAERQAKIDAELRAKKEAEENAKAESERKARLEAEEKRKAELQPDREKLMKFIDSLEFTSDKPKLKDPAANEIMNFCISRIGEVRTELTNKTHELR